VIRGHTPEGRFPCTTAPIPTTLLVLYTGRHLPQIILRKGEAPSRRRQQRTTIPLSMQRSRCVRLQAMKPIVGTGSGSTNRPLRRAHQGRKEPPPLSLIPLYAPAASRCAKAGEANTSARYARLLHTGPKPNHHRSSSPELPGRPPRAPRLYYYCAWVKAQQRVPCAICAGHQCITASRRSPSPLRPAAKSPPLVCEARFGEAANSRSPPTAGVEAIEVSGPTSLHTLLSRKRRLPILPSHRSRLQVVEGGTSGIPFGETLGTRSRTEHQVNVKCERCGISTRPHPVHIRLGCSLTASRRVIIMMGGGLPVGPPQRASLVLSTVGRRRPTTTKDIRRTIRFVLWRLANIPGA
jgi:hypothetical protein